MVSWVQRNGGKWHMATTTNKQHEILNTEAKILKTCNNFINRVHHQRSDID